MNTDTATRRQVLAFLALADAPIPDEIKFADDAGKVKLEITTFAAADACMAAFGADVSWWGGDHVSVLQEHGIATRVSYRREPWKGWNIQIRASEPLAEVDAGLDATTREQLAVVVDEDAPEVDR